MIRLIGQRNTTGIGRHYTGFCDAIKHRQNTIEVDGFSEDVVRRESVLSTNDDVNVSFVSIDYGAYFRGRHIQWTVFETTKVPDQVRMVLDRADAIWVPSGWGRDILVVNGYDPDRIDIVPEGVDPRWHVGDRIAANKKLKFLCVAKYETRKGIRELIQSWKESYANDADMQLIIKTWAWRESESRYREIINSIQGTTNITVLWGHATDEQMLELYHSADAFVLPTRGEGWGLPIIEAAACGLPIITIPYSGHMEFLDSIWNSVVPINYDLRIADDTDLEFCYPRFDRDWGSWAVPSDRAIRRAIDQARQDIEMLRYYARTNSEIIRERYSWKASTDRALEVLEQRNML